MSKSKGNSKWRRIVRFGQSNLGEVEEYFSTRRGNGKICCRGKNKNTTPWDQQLINERNAEDNLRWAINCNFKPGDLHIALTYKKGERPSGDECLKRVQKFLRKLRYYYKKLGKPFKYIWTTELGERGAIHHHFILEYIDLRLLQSFWPWGKVHLNDFLDNTGEYEVLAWYLIKNNRKAFCSSKFPNKKRFNASHNLVKPIIYYKRIKGKTFRADPKDNKSYEIIPGSFKQGIHGITATPWRRYKVRFLI